VIPKVCEANPKALMRATTLADFAKEADAYFAKVVASKGK